jgi:hypothetical protein
VLQYDSTTGLWGAGTVAGAVYQPTAPSSPQNGDIWIDSDATASVINTNDFLLKADATALYTPLSGQRSGIRNEIINGDFRINQRGYTSGSNLASGAYGFDRWKSNFTNTTLTFTSAPQGQMLTINSGGGIEQVIEQSNIVAGTYILSWTGTATGRVYNTGATPPSYAASPITVTLDGTANVEVEFTASGGSRTLQNVQLEPGTVATPFEQRAIGLELSLCQRYYWRGGNGSPGIFNTSSTARYSVIFPVTMRVAPTISAITAPIAINPTVSEGQTGSQTTGFAQTSGSGSIQTNSASQIQLGGFSSGIDGRPTTMLNNCLDFSAEL